MKIRFLKDHIDYKEDDIVEDHPNADYLQILGVAELIKEKPATKEKAKDEPDTKDKEAIAPKDKKGK